MTDQQKTETFIRKMWDESIFETLKTSITIPNQSPLFDPEWATNGFMEQATKLVTDWIDAQKIEGLKYRVERLEGRTELLFVTIDATDGSDKSILLYSHLDKQPPLTKDWDAAKGLHPHKPVVLDGKLYGRGAADDFYGGFASLTAVMALKAQGIPHPRCVVIMEHSEESGSRDLPTYVNHLAEEIGDVSLIVCLDSGCGNYDQMWTTTSLRGLVAGTLRVDIINNGVHSGLASGIVPDSFRILRNVLSRLEDPDTGVVKADAFCCKIPEHRVKEADVAAGILGETIYTSFPFVGKAGPVDGKPADLLLNRTWRAALSVTGVDGMPTLEAAGNVLRPTTAVKLSLRLPPAVQGSDAAVALKELLEKDPPYGAKVVFTADKAATGWDAPKLDPWLDSAVQAASARYFEKPPACEGQGGSIPFMGQLAERFPQAQFLVTGVLGPASNAHGPDEFLHIEFTQRLMMCVTDIVAAASNK